MTDKNENDGKSRMTGSFVILNNVKDLVEVKPKQPLPVILNEVKDLVVVKW